MPADFGLSPAAFLAAGALALGPGYLLSLRRFAARRGRTGDPESWPAIDAVVPTHDEAGRIEAKIRNLRALAYPGAIRFWIVDGASADGTPAIAGDPRFSVVALSVADKTAQLNRAFAPKNAARDGVEAAWRHAGAHSCFSCYNTWLNENRAIFDLHPAVLANF